MLGIGTLVSTAWRATAFSPGYVEVIPANYGTAGSQQAVRRRRTDTVIAPPDPRIRPFNTMTGIVWRLRIIDAAKMQAIASHAPQQLSQPVNFTSPRTASLLTNGPCP